MTDTKKEAPEITDKQIDEALKQLKSLRDYTAKNLSEPYSDDDVMALDKAIAALERQRVPEGWKLVPVKSTREMHRAADMTSDPWTVWSKMLAAAPEPESG